MVDQAGPPRDPKDLCRLSYRVRLARFRDSDASNRPLFREFGFEMTRAGGCAMHARREHQKLNSLFRPLNARFG